MDLRSFNQYYGEFEKMMKFLNEKNGEKDNEIIKLRN